MKKSHERKNSYKLYEKVDEVFVKCEKKKGWKVYETHDTCCSKHIRKTFIKKRAKYLWQNVPKIITKRGSFFIIKHVSLITKCGKYYKTRRIYYKMRQVLQNTSFITKQVITIHTTPVLPVLISLLCTLKLGLKLLEVDPRY